MKQKDKNTTLKIVALLVAIVLWLYVGIEEDPMVHHTYEVQLEIENLPVDKTATLSEETVEVRVLGRQDRLRTLSAEDFKATVDLNDVKAGEMDATVELELPSEVYLARVEPRTVKVQIDQRDGRQMPVEVITSGILPDGVQLENISVEPESVFVTGSRAQLEALDYVGVAVDLNNVYENGSDDASVMFYDVSGSPMDSGDLEASPSTVSVQIEVRQSATEKLVPVQANLVGNVARGIEIASVSVSPESITVSGSPAELAEVSSVSTAPIDVTEITETTTRTVAIESDYVPKGTEVTVTLTVSSSVNGDTPSSDTGEGALESYVKMLPLTVSGQAQGAVTLDVSTVEVRYHMQDGYADAGGLLNVYVQIDEVPQAQTTASVQVSSVNGLIVDSVSPSVVTIYPNTIEEQ